jgi:hypothetical protein
MRRTIALVAIVAGVVIGSKLLLENILGVSLEPFARSWMANPGWPAAAVVIGLLAADILIPVPSSIVMVLSGAVFGVWWGALLAFIGSIGGEWLGFELARRYGASWFARFIGDPRRRGGGCDAGAADRDGDDERGRRAVGNATANLLAGVGDRHCTDRDCLCVCRRGVTPDRQSRTRDRDPDRSGRRRMDLVPRYSDGAFFRSVARLSPSSSDAFT